MRKKSYFIVLCLIMVLGFMLRAYKIASMPPLNADEAALGYNAYSLIQTGRDEHGNSWPIHFQSFNDYKPGGYVYLILPMVYFFGLNAISVRLVSVFLGVLSVGLIALFVRNWFGNIQKEKKEIFSLSAAFILAISPWHIHFSRGGWEVNVATAFLLLGVYLFTKTSKKPIFYLPSILALVFSLYFYHAVRLVAPLLGLGLLSLKFPSIKRNIKHFSASIIVGILIAIPLVVSLFFGGGLSRAGGVGIISDIGLVNRINELRGQHKDPQGQGRLVHNKPLQYGLELMANWGEHYEGEFLFVSGDEIQRNRIPETGLLYLVEIIFIVISGFSISKNPKGWGFIFWWLIVAPIPAALTFQSPHALRSQNMVIPMSIFSGYGLAGIVFYARKQKPLLKYFLYLLLCLTMVWSLSRYLIMYYKHMPKEYPYSSQYGFKQMVDFVSEHENNYQKIYITTRYDQPYILYLFYTKYSPSKFQSEHVLTQPDEYGFSTVNNFSKYHFGSINYEEVIQLSPSSLIIGTDEEIPDWAHVVYEVYFPSGDIAFQIADN